MGPWMCDLNDTITATPDLMRAICRGLRDAGHEIHILTGCQQENVTPDIGAEKFAQLAQAGFKQGRDYDKVVVVSGPEKHVARNKVQYMQHVGAAGLIDDRKRNVKAARKAGFMALRHVDPKK